jgi:peroxiredoxin
MAHNRTHARLQQARRTARPQVSTRRAKQRRRKRRQPRRMRWGLLAVAAAALAVTAMLLVTSRDTTGQARQQAAKAAPAFTLTATDGRRVSLADYAGRNLMLYFSEGVGCDGCWYQMADLEKRQGDLDKLGLTVLPVVVNDPAATRAEMRRFNLRTPFLTDPGGVVARAYDAVGSASAMHATLPGHTFILVDPSGRMTWRGEYPSMFVPASQLLDTVRAVLPPTVTLAGQG